MKRPPSLVGTAVGCAYVCKDWELRITARCLAADLNASSASDFDAVSGLEIVRALVRDRSDHLEGTRDVNGLSCGVKAWVLSHGNDHRGATIHDSDGEVVWLVAYKRHRSGQSDDFFPYCRALDEDGRLLPTEEDYKNLIRERDRRFVEAVRVEAPVVLSHARCHPGEHRHLLGGDLAAGIAVEVDPDIEAITIAFRFDAVDWDLVPVLCAAFHPHAGWELADRLPSRVLEAGEVAMTVVYEPSA